jgi:hypothetical protein
MDSEAEPVRFRIRAFFMPAPSPLFFPMVDSLTYWDAS